MAQESGNSLDRSRNRSGGAGVVLLVILAVVVAIVVGGIVWSISARNQMVRLNERVKSSWSQVEVVLQRRFDLIPNLVNTVKGYAKQEKDVLTEVTRLRSQWAGASSTGQKVKTANAMEGALGRLMVVVERYPDLKSNQNFLALQSQLEGTENRVAVERRRYNLAVQSYNSYIRSFPQDIIAQKSGFKVDENYFKSAPAAQEAPKVKF